MLVPRVGDRLAPHLVLRRRLDAGGMGIVWAALHEKLNTEVVVKLLAQDLAGDEAARTRFAREITSASRVRSPHVVQMLDHGITEGNVPYIVMELLEGANLARVLKRGPLPPHEVLHIVEGVASALTAAHEAGVVHRDIKPANVFLCHGTPRPFVKVVDFGIAKRTGDVSMTLTNGVVGTPAYMSPEQMRADVDVDHRCDLWALGVLAFHALTGRLPFRGNNILALAHSIMNDWPQITPHLPELGPAIDLWVDKALARGQDQRFSSARELADALAEALGDAATGPGRPEKTPRGHARAPAIHPRGMEKATIRIAMPHDEPEPPASIVGRRIRQYLVGEQLASGGMARVHLAKQVGDRGFQRIVAVKRLHPALVASRKYTRQLEREALLAARIRHPNVVQTIDMVAADGEVLVVMEYVHGASLSSLLHAAGAPLDPSVAATIVHDLLLGLDAAHEARDERGRSLAIIHRDVSPQNVLVGLDGSTRLTDFGIARWVADDTLTTAGFVRGKPRYMPPEQRHGLELTRQADLYAVAVVLAEALTGYACPEDERQAAIWCAEIGALLRPFGLERFFLTATSENARNRHASAAEMAAEIAGTATLANRGEVGRVVERLVGGDLEVIAEYIARLEREDSANDVVRTEIDPHSVVHTEIASLVPAPALTIAMEPLRVVATRPAPRRAGGPSRLLTALALAAMLGGVLVIVGSASSSRTGLLAPAVTTAPTNAPTPASQPSVPSQLTPGAPAPALPAAAPTAFDDEPRSAPLMPAPSLSTPPDPASADQYSPKRKSGRKAPAAKSPREDCSNPFYLDDNGDRHFKPGCL